MNNYDNYFMGLDIGTNSVGWCVSYANYKVLKYKNNAMWVVSLFDPENQASDRRQHRCNRRRFDRRNQRISLQEELFAKEISKIDSDFFLRRKESALLPEDRSYENGGYVFENPALDKAYHDKYPTIHHLICDLMKNKAPHDVRLVFIAVAWILAHRGHFLLDVEVNNIDKINNISELFHNLMSWFDTQEYVRPFECNPEQFGEILTNEKRKQEREHKLKDLLWNGKKAEQDSDSSIDAEKLVKLVSGLKVKLSELFGNPEYDEIEHNSISLADGNFDETAEALCSEIDSDDMELIRIAKSIFDWGQLENIRNGKDYISEAKVEVYETHKKDLKLLKRLVKKYIPKKYFEIFRKADGNLNNYVKYSANLKNADLGKANVFKNCLCEDFCKFIKGVFNGIVPDEEDKSVFEQ